MDGQAKQAAVVCHSILGYSEWAAGWATLGSNSVRGNRFFFAPKHLVRLCGPPSLLLNWYLGSLLGNAVGV